MFHVQIYEIKLIFFENFIYFSFNFNLLRSKRSDYARVFLEFELVILISFKNKLRLCEINNDCNRNRCITCYTKCNTL